jgi:hypothetical protein
LQQRPHLHSEYSSSNSRSSSSLSIETLALAVQQINISNEEGKKVNTGFAVQQHKRKRRKIID